MVVIPYQLLDVPDSVWIGEFMDVYGHFGRFYRFMNCVLSCMQERSALRITDSDGSLLILIFFACPALSSSQ